MSEQPVHVCSAVLFTADQKEATGSSLEMHLLECQMRLRMQTQIKQGLLHIPDALSFL